MSPYILLLSSNNHVPVGFRVRTSPTRKERLHRSVRVRNAESGRQCRYCWPADCSCF